MTIEHDTLTATIRQCLADAAVSSTRYDTDTLAGVIATAVDPDHEKAEPEEPGHELADGNPPPSNLGQD